MPALRTVYRIEMDGRGPYSSDLVRLVEGRNGIPEGRHHDPDRCPSPYDDKGFPDLDHPLRAVEEQLGCTHSESRFGFTSKRQLNRWFTPKAQRLMGDFEGTLVTYRVPRAAVFATKRQCVFNVTAAVSRVETALV